MAPKSDQIVSSAILRNTAEPAPTSHPTPTLTLDPAESWIKNQEALTKRLFQSSKANQAAAHRQDHFINICPLFIPQTPAKQLMQPSDGSLDNPTQGPQPSEVREATPGKPAPALDASLSRCLLKRPSQGRGQRALAADGCGAHRPATNLRDRNDQRRLLRQVVRISARESRGQRLAERVCDQLVLKAGLASVRRIRSSFFPQGPRAPVRNRPRHMTIRVARPDVTPTALFHAASPRDQLATAHANAVSQSSHSSRIEPTASPTGCHF